MSYKYLGRRPGSLKSGDGLYVSRYSPVLFNQHRLTFNLSIYIYRLQLNSSVKLCETTPRPIPLEMSSSVYVCYLFLIFVCSGQECLNPVLIEVDNVNGSDNPACLVIGGRSCQSLSFVLGSLVTSNYNEFVDCIHLSLVPNEEAYNLEYRQTDILVQSMLTMVSSSESAAAKIACILSGKTNFSDKIEGDGVRSVLNFTGRSSFSSVEMRRISFARCERPIRFNNLTGLTVENCSFE